jgi:hypothetical protein
MNSMSRGCRAQAQGAFHRHAHAIHTAPAIASSALPRVVERRPGGGGVLEDDVGSVGPRD